MFLHWFRCVHILLNGLFQGCPFCKMHADKNKYVRMRRFATNSWLEKVLLPCLQSQWMHVTVNLNSALLKMSNVCMLRRNCFMTTWKSTPVQTKKKDPLRGSFFSYRPSAGAAPRSVPTQQKCCFAPKIFAQKSCLSFALQIEQKY